MEGQAGCSEKGQLGRKGEQFFWSALGGRVADLQSPIKEAHMSSYSECATSGTRPGPGCYLKKLPRQKGERFFDLVSKVADLRRPIRKRTCRRYSRALAAT